MIPQFDTPGSIFQILNELLVSGHKLKLQVEPARGGVASGLGSGAWGPTL